MIVIPRTFNCANYCTWLLHDIRIKCCTTLHFKFSFVTDLCVLSNILPYTEPIQSLIIQVRHFSIPEILKTIHYFLSRLSCRYIFILLCCFRCTALYGVPTMFIDLLNYPEFEKFDLSTLYTGIMAGSPCPIETMKQVIAKMHMYEVTVCLHNLHIINTAINLSS